MEGGFSLLVRRWVGGIPFGRKVAMLALVQGVGKRFGPGDRSLCQDLRGLADSRGARTAELPACPAGGAKVTGGSGAPGSRLRGSSGSPQPWCRRPGTLLLQPFHLWQGARQPLEIPGPGFNRRGYQTDLLRDRSWWSLCRCPEQSLKTLCFGTRASTVPQKAWSPGDQLTGTPWGHLKHTDQRHTSNGSFAHTKKCQHLPASPWQFWCPGIQARMYCPFAGGQASLLASRWPQKLPLLPAARVNGTCSYHTTSHPTGVECRVVDLRSDTVTRPSPEMRQAMAMAEVGQDDYGEDPTVNELQRVVADLLGMEEALFVPTATMANLIAVMCHCRRRGAQVLLGREAHIHVFEHGGIAQVAGVHSEILQDLPNGTLDLDGLERKIQQTHQSRYHPRPELLCLENTHCSAGGRVLPLKYLQKVHQLAQQYSLRIHIDGARVLNASVALGVLPRHIAQHCDSITLCLSKGVGAPAGALLAGAREFITEAWRVRKLLGGGMCQAGVLAAAALVGLKHVEETLKRDHDNARCFAQGASAIASPFCSIDLATVETNIIMVTTLTPWLTPSKLCELMEAVSAEEVAATGQATSVLLFPWGEHCLRAVWHCDISSCDSQLAGIKLRFILDKCKQQHPTGVL